MKKQNIFTTIVKTISEVPSLIWEGVTMPFVAMSILIDEDMRFNEDGYWNKHFERKNRKLEKKEKRREQKAARLTRVSHAHSTENEAFSESMNAQVIQA